MRFGITVIIFLAWCTAAPSFTRIADTAALPGNQSALPSRETGPVSFVSEEIALRITGGRVTVTGRYHLHSSLPGKNVVPLAYPFPVGAKADYPDTIRVFRGKDLASVEFVEDRKQAAIIFRIEAEGDFEFTVVYSQRLRAREATYILTTTREWGSPLRTAEFRVTLPNHLIPVYWSHPPNRIEKNGNFTTYSIHRTDFFPGRDLTVRWMPRKER